MKFTNIDCVVKLVYMNVEFRIDMDLYSKIADPSYWQARWQVYGQMYGQMYRQIIPIENKFLEEPHK